MDLAASDNYVYFHMTTWGSFWIIQWIIPPVSFARTVGSNAAALNMGWRTMAQCRACHLMSDSNFWSFHERSNCAFSKRPASATPEETTWQNCWSSLGYIIVTFVPRCPPARQGKCELWSCASKNHGHVQWSRLHTFITSVSLCSQEHPSGILLSINCSALPTSLSVKRGSPPLLAIWPVGQVASRAFNQRCRKTQMLEDLDKRLKEIYTSSSPASRWRKFQKKKELYSRERICL